VKPVKLYFLTVISALMILSFVGTSSAVAEKTVLCSEDESPCSESHWVKHVHWEASIAVTLLSSVLTVECGLLYLGPEVLSISTPLFSIHFVAAYSNCNNNCTVTEENGPAEIKISREGSELAKVTGGVLFHVVCSGFLNCKYTGVGLVGHALGPLSSSEENGSVVFSEQTLNKESGTFCPSTNKLDLTTTPLEPTYITS